MSYQPGSGDSEMEECARKHWHVRIQEALERQHDSFPIGSWEEDYYLAGWAFFVNHFTPDYQLT